MRVLILCTGNSCRSQMAHGFLQSFDKNIEVYSGGTDPAAQVNTKAVEVMKEVGIDISSHVPTHVNTYLDQEWDYVITVCGGANESCPAFTGNVGKRLHIGFDDPSHVTGTPEFIEAEFRRVRNEIKNAFARFYITEIRNEELPAFPCGSCGYYTYSVVSFFCIFSSNTCLFLIPLNAFFRISYPITR